MINHNNLLTVFKFLKFSKDKNISKIREEKIININFVLNVKKYLLNIYLWNFFKKFQSIIKIPRS